MQPIITLIILVFLVTYSRSINIKYYSTWVFIISLLLTGNIELSLIPTLIIELKK